MVVGSVSFDVRGEGGGVSPNLDPFGLIENGGGGAKIEHFS